MKKLFDLLSGKKTYVIAIAAGLCVIAQQLGYDIPNVIWELLGVTVVVTGRAAIKKSGG